MKRFAWLTDIHFNCAEESVTHKLLDSLSAAKPEGVIISGDIGEAHTVQSYLERIASALACPIYFVLGNHDFYYGSITMVRRAVHDLCQAVPSLHWLTEDMIVPVSDSTALIGHDGWADGRNGDFANSDVTMPDYLLIEELTNIYWEDRLQKLNALGDEAADYFQELLPIVLRQFENVILVTHAPPFREACWYEGRISDDNYLPHFSCQAVGNVLRRIMDEYPSRHLTVLCGHTHGHGVVQIGSNILVKTGGAEYGAPDIQEILEIE